MKLVGKVLWWDSNDQNGIIIDTYGNEFYFDVSVIGDVNPRKLKSGTIIQFSQNSLISNVNCACSITLLPSKSKAKFDKEFERNRQLTFQL